MPTTRPSEAALPEEAAYDTPILLGDLPGLADPIIDEIAATNPDVLIANDRGARLLALAIMKGWRTRFGDRPISCLDHKIQFARLSSKSMNTSQLEHSTHFALASYGLKPEATDPLRIILIDDWIDTGNTFRQFERSVRSFGLANAVISFATLCGAALEGQRHFVSDPTRNTRNSVWNAYEDYAGVAYFPDEPTRPHIWPNPMAKQARAQLSKHSKNFYQIRSEGDTSKPATTS